MKKATWMTGTALAALSLTFALTGCSNSPAPAPAHTPKATHSATATPTPTATDNGAAEQMNSGKNYDFPANTSTMDVNGTTVSCPDGTATAKVFFEKDGKTVKSFDCSVALSTDDQNTINELGNK